MVVAGMAVRLGFSDMAALSNSLRAAAVSGSSAEDGFMRSGGEGLRLLASALSAICVGFGKVYRLGSEDFVGW